MSIRKFCHALDADVLELEGVVASLVALFLDSFGEAPEELRDLGALGDATGSMGAERMSAASLAMVVAELGALLWGVREALGHAVQIHPPTRTACEKFLAARHRDMAEQALVIFDGLEGLCGQERVAPLRLEWQHRLEAWAKAYASLGSSARATPESMGLELARGLTGADLAQAIFVLAQKLLAAVTGRPQRVLQVFIERVRSRRALQRHPEPRELFGLRYGETVFISRLAAEFRQADDGTPFGGYADTGFLSTQQGAAGLDHVAPPTTGRRSGLSLIHI